MKNSIIGENGRIDLNRVPTESDYTRLQDLIEEKIDRMSFPAGGYKARSIKGKVRIHSVLKKIEKSRTDGFNLPAKEDYDTIMGVVLNRMVYKKMLHYGAAVYEKGKYTAVYIKK